MFLILERNWWLILVRGTLAFLFGLLCFAYPDINLLIMRIMFGAYALTDGVLALVSGLSTVTGQRRWLSAILEGIAGVLLGLFALIWPGLTAFGLLYLIGAWGIVRGIFEVTAAIRLRQTFNNEWLLLVTGGGSILFGLLIFVVGRAGVLAVLFWIGTYALVFGMFYVMLALRLRGWISRE